MLYASPAKPLPMRGVPAEYDHSRTGIVLGHSTYLHRGQGNLIQHNIVLDQTIELLQGVFPSLGRR